ncbi:TPA: hypothetical protein DCQ44_03240 [Candidatus Taylorbacteria bacterium]|nr:hypothetical protein [Candidatus Taylorbacteria bacterium]
MTELLRKKVIFVITKSNFGGAQRYVFDLATSLPKDSFDVIVAFGQGGELEEKLRAADIRTIKIEALQRDVSVIKDLAVFFELIRIFKKEKPDVVHLNSTKIGGVGAVAGRICRVPKIIFTAHGWAFNEKRGAISRLAISFLQWVTVMCAHTTITVSQKTAEQILKFPFIRANKIKVIFNGVGNENGATDLDFFNRDEARQLLLGATTANTTTIINEHSAWIGTISELHTNKGLDIGLRAFALVLKKHPDTFFIIIGEGEERTRLSAQISELGISDRAILVGSIEDAKRYLKAFDIFSLTSRTEALPYVILEAGLAELPVVASAVGGIPEIINLPDLGLLVPFNEKVEQSFAAAFDELLSNKEYAKTLGINLKHRVMTEFSKQKMHTETFAQY